LRRFSAVFTLPPFVLAPRLLLPAVRFFFISTTPRESTLFQDANRHPPKVIL
jgi:hypothetical protein